MGVLTNRAIASSLLASVAFASVAFDTNPAEARNNTRQTAAQREAAEQAQATKDHQRCDTMARDNNIDQIKYNGQVFLETSNDACIFKIVRSDSGKEGLRYNGHYNLSDAKENRAYSQIFDKAQKASETADARAQRQAEQEAKKAERGQNKIVDGIQRQVESIVGGEARRAISKGLRDLMPSW